MNDKKIAVVTGSLRGIGLSIAETLLKEDYYVVFSATREEAEAKKILDFLSKPNISAEYIKCDISLKKDRENLFNQVISKHKRLDLLINNAGVAPKNRSDILEVSEDSFDHVLGINLKGSFFMCQTAANIMIKTKEEDIKDFSPRIINISSISAYTSSTNRGEYCISKAGVSMLTQLFADKLSEYNIPVFEVRPGIILTDMTEAVKEKYQSLINDGLVPLKRFGKPQDVSSCILALANGYFDFCTGQVINADGGFHIRRL